jgi:hypothetical protein
MTLARREEIPNCGNHQSNEKVFLPSVILRNVAFAESRGAEIQKSTVDFFLHFRHF